MKQRILTAAQNLKRKIKKVNQQGEREEEVCGRIITTHP